MRYEPTQCNTELRHLISKNTQPLDFINLKNIELSEFIEYTISMSKGVQSFLLLLPMLLLVGCPIEEVNDHAAAIAINTEKLVKDTSSLALAAEKVAAATNSIATSASQASDTVNKLTQDAEKMTDKFLAKIDSIETNAKQLIDEYGPKLETAFENLEDVPIQVKKLSSTIDMLFNLAITNTKNVDFKELFETYENATLVLKKMKEDLGITKAIEKAAIELESVFEKAKTDFDKAKPEDQSALIDQAITEINTKKEAYILDKKSIQIVQGYINSLNRLKEEADSVNDQEEAQTDKEKQKEEDYIKRTLEKYIN